MNELLNRFYKLKQKQLNIKKKTNLKNELYLKMNYPTVYQQII
jgi:hypothetical protein